MQSNQILDNPDFATALTQEREARGISRNQLAEKMIAEFGAGKGVAANLWHMEKGTQNPSEARVRQIVDAMASCGEDSVTEKDRLLSKLMAAAGVGGISDISQVEYLRRKCEKQLDKHSELERHEIQTILSHISVATMKRIAEADYATEDVVRLLEDISQELSNKANVAAPSEFTLGGEDYKFEADHVFVGGNARILVKGHLDPDQHVVLEKMAQAIMYVVR